MNWMYQMKCIAYVSCRRKVTKTHTRAHKCSLIFDIRYLICVAWLHLLGVLFGSAKTRLIHKSQMFYSNITWATLAQVDFCTLANNASCSSKREHIPHKNDTKWIGIKYSFIQYLIIYCSLMNLKIISNYLGVTFCWTHTVMDLSTFNLIIFRNLSYSHAWIFTDI